VRFAVGSDENSRQSAIEDVEDVEDGHDEPRKAKRESQASSSDDEAVVKSPQKASAAALFGEGELSTSSDDEEKEKAVEERAEPREMTEDDIVGPRLYPEPDEDEDEAGPTETIIEVEAPKINVELGPEGPFFVKFPNFLSVESRPFDVDHYEDEVDEDDQLDEEGRNRLKLRVENTIRWRYAQDPDGNIIKQSNAKMVRWSDGTMSLYLGSEIFDVHLQPIQDHNHLFVRQGAGLQGQAVFRNKMTFRPHSTDTMTHRKMTMSMADRSNKKQKVKVLAAVGKDPETEKQALIRKEEERLRATIRRETQQRRVRDRLSGRHGLSAGFLEDRDDYSDEGESLSAIKRSYKMGRGMPDRRERALSDSDSDAGARRIDTAKSAEAASDSDTEMREKKKTKKKIVIEDEDE